MDSRGFDSSTYFRPKKFLSSKIFGIETMDFIRDGEDFGGVVDDYIQRSLCNCVWSSQLNSEEFSVLMD